MYPALEVVIHKLVTNSQNLIAEAVKAQAEAASSIYKHTEVLKKAMDDTSDVGTTSCGIIIFKQNGYGQSSAWPIFLNFLKIYNIKLQSASWFVLLLGICSL